MAVITAIRCPNCEKRFKPTTQVQGKKIKCPFCSQPFVAPSAKASKTATKPEADNEAGIKAKSAAKPKPQPAPPVVAEAPKPVDNDLDADHNPYGVKDQDLTPRCPHCAKELESANSIICLHCGYNTLTREAGKTEKTFGLTFERHFMYLLPALGAATFAFFSVVFLIYYAVVSPYHVAGVPILSLTDHESLRMWTTVIFLAWIYAAGTFCFKKFIVKPKPDEIKTDAY
jgi:DNA-directed RNA polymerase subunit RPC12/RpoP